MYHFYKIINRNNNKVVYIGCTTQRLNTRFAQHNRDLNSSVYQKYIMNGITNLSIQEINIKFHSDISHVDALKYEEILTYIYGSIYELCNFNAGNSMFNKIDIDKLYTYIMLFVHDIMDGNIILYTKDYKEIIEIMKTFFNITDVFNEPMEELQYIYNIACENSIDMI